MLMTALAAASVPPAPAAERSVCPVCRVMEGEDETEDVRATRAHEGVSYGFCSEKCARAFDADPAAFVPPTLPRLAPELALADLEGRPLTWESLAGRVVLVDFWATWCAPCRKSMPELQALHARFAGRGFTVVGVSIDEAKDARKVKKFVAAKGITYPVALDGAQASAWERFRVKAVPAAFLVDRDGRIVAQWTGTSTDAAALERMLETMLAQVD